MWPPSSVIALTPWLSTTVKEAERKKRASATIRRLERNKRKKWKTRVVKMEDRSVYGSKCLVTY
jgi:hypothetical protein